MITQCISLFIAILSTSSLFAGIEAYFKKPAHKSDVHKMKNIDFIYTINLDERPEKFADCCERLQPYRIVPFRFSAVNGWQLSLSVINDVGVKYTSSMPKGMRGTTFELGEVRHHEIMHVIGRSYLAHYMSRGTIGIVLSHLSILQDAYDSGYNTIWVMEDDIEIIQSPHFLPILIDKLDALVGKEGWDVLFTDQDTKNRQGATVTCSSYGSRPNFSPRDPSKFAMKKYISSDFRKIGARYGAYSMIIRRTGMKKLLDFFKNYKVFYPYDMDFTQPEGIQLYTVTKDVISTQPNALSDNGLPKYKEKNR